LRDAYDRSQLLLNASVALLESQTIGDVLASTHQMVGRTFDPINIGMVLLDEHGDLRVATSEPLPEHITDRWLTIPVTAPVPAAQVFRTGQLMALADPDEIAEAFPSGVDDLRRLGWQAIACAPIPGVRGTLGAMTIAWQHPHEVTVPERAVIASIAGYAGQAIERVNQLDRHNTAAATLQTALLPPLPKVDPLRMVVRYLPAHQEDHVGGDWYDAVALPGDRLAVVIGDASGHSLEAAAAMSELRSMLRGFLVDRVEPPSALLRRLDHANRTLAANTIATVLIAFLDPAPDGAYLLTWSNAGHPPPLVINPDGAVTRLSGADALIGAVRHASRSNRSHVVPAGAKIVLHTDGLVETRSEPLNVAFARLDRLLGDHHTATPPELADRLIEYAEEHSHEDDVALLIIGTPERSVDD
ncbi:GAF domain-containing SpoIIE family protein phosphatase, partial [Actinoplanes sp. NPDC051633]|uniref:PP2C family protein-serine/threonine phosphatase n=1 Tax=Actinoplanes sp. NPDC051633 TaxID=3155670 RepID=UPI00343F0E7B